jgi:uncharacterized membrane protein (UPF0127 family)
MADMRVVHEQDDTLGEDAPNRRIIATDVDVADTVLSSAKGLMFRSGIPDEYALVMEVGGNSPIPFASGPPRQVVHMLFVRFALDVIWLDGGEVVRVARMKPWRSIAMAKADVILELPAGNADGVEPGDTIRIEDRDGTLVESIDGMKEEDPAE